MLTHRNKAALDLYLSEDPECKGNGTASWMRVYGTQNRASARAAWARMLASVSAQNYLHTRQTEIEEARRVDIAFDRDRYMEKLDDMLRVTSAEYVGEDGRVHLEDAGQARQIAKDLYAAETNNVFPFQQDTGLRVSININTQYQGNPVEEIEPQPREICASGREHETAAAESGARTPTRQRVIIGNPKNSPK